MEVRQGDYNDRAGFERVLQGVDTVLLVSGMDAPDKRIGQHRNVIQAARTAGVKKIVYTSVQGPEQGSSFSPVVQSNRQTEQDVRDSGLAWVIGRNGIYIEPDIEYIDQYKALGEIANCAGNGKCGYTTRDELGYAYAQMLTSDAHNGLTYNLHGQSLSQTELASCLNQAFGTSLVYRAMSVEEYRQDRVNELGEFIGTIIAKHLHRHPRRCLQPCQQLRRSRRTSTPDMGRLLCGTQGGYVALKRCRYAYHNRPGW